VGRLKRLLSVVRASERQELERPEPAGLKQQEQMKFLAIQHCGPTRNAAREAAQRRRNRRFVERLWRAWPLLSEVSISQLVALRLAQGQAQVQQSEVEVSVVACSVRPSSAAKLRGRGRCFRDQL
jgi:hypothetical protein